MLHVHCARARVCACVRACMCMRVVCVCVFVWRSSQVGRTEKKKERKKEDEQFGCLANFQFSTSAMLFASLTVLLVTKQPKRKVRGL